MCTGQCAVVDINSKCWRTQITAGTYLLKRDGVYLGLLGGYCTCVRCVAATWPVCAPIPEATGPARFDPSHFQEGCVRLFPRCLCRYVTKVG